MGAYSFSLQLTVDLQKASIVAFLRLEVFSDISYTASFTWQLYKWAQAGQRNKTKQQYM
jgi:hypothetical protein